MKKRIAILVAFVSLTTLLLACVAAVRVAPPAPRIEVYGAPPYAGAVWIAGYWQRRGGEWVWIPGQWQRPPRPHGVWIPGHWEERPGGWVWFKGRWEYR